MNLIKNNLIAQPEHTAVRVALWRALHTEVDEKPFIFEDTLGAEIVAEENWRGRPDMNREFCKQMRASVTGRARFIEDLVKLKIEEGINQYIILGAGLDTFAQRNMNLLSRIRVYEIDQPGSQHWKKNRLREMNFSIPNNLHFIPVDFEKGESWVERIFQADFDKNKPAIIISAGVSMYLNGETNRTLLADIAKFHKGTVFAMTFMLDLELLEDGERELMEFVMKKAALSGTPFLSLFRPEEIIKMAKESGFSSANYISGQDLFAKYFSERNDNLNPGNAEAFLVTQV